MTQADDRSPPPSESTLKTVVPAVVGLFCGVGVGVLLGRTVFAPRAPAASPGWTPPLTSGGTVMPGGALGADAAHLELRYVPPTEAIPARRFAEAVAGSPIDWSRVPGADDYARSVVEWVREASINPHAPLPPKAPLVGKTRAAGSVGKAPVAAKKTPVGTSVPWSKMPLPPAPRKAGLPTATAAPSGASATTIDELLRTCPTYDEMLQIRRDFNVTFVVDRDYRDTFSFPPMSCTLGGEESSAQLTLYNIFRAAKFLRFDEPMPITGATNLYDYLRSLNLRVIYVFHYPEGMSFARDGEERSLHLSDVALGSPDKRFWVEPRSGVGLGDALGLVLHESRHAVGYYHQCEQPEFFGADTNLAYGGAWAVQYWYYRWLAEHTGDQLSAYEKSLAAGAADAILRVRFCEDGTEALSPEQIARLHGQK